MHVRYIITPLDNGLEREKRSGYAELGQSHFESWIFLTNILKCPFYFSYLIESFPDFI